MSGRKSPCREEHASQEAMMSRLLITLSEDPERVVCIFGLDDLQVIMIALEALLDNFEETDENSRKKLKRARELLEQLEQLEKAVS